MQMKLDVVFMTIYTQYIQASMLTFRFKHAALEWIHRNQVDCWDKLKALASNVQDDTLPGDIVPNIRGAHAFVQGKNATLATYAMEYAYGSKRMEEHKLVAIGAKVALLVAIIECGLDRRGDIPGDFRAQCEHVFADMDEDITTPYETLRNVIQTFLETPYEGEVPVNEIDRLYNKLERAFECIQDADPDLISVLLSN